MTRNRRTGRPRDIQRKRVYKSEMETYGPYSDQFKNRSEVVEFARCIINDPYVKRQYGTLGQVAFVFSGNRAMHTFKGKNNHKIRLPRWAWQKNLIIHELSHAYTYQIYDFTSVQGHGPEFCNLYLDLVNRFLGKNLAKVLTRKFIKNKVKARVLGDIE